MRNLVLIGVFCLFSLWSAGAQAQTDETPQFKEGVDYFKIDKPFKYYSQDNEVEAVAFFWYGCGGCYMVDPALNEWQATLPENVKFVKLPALFNNVWDLHGRIFLTIKALNAKPEVHAALFEAVSKQGMQFNNRDQLSLFIKSQGLNEEDFFKKFDSPEIKDQMEQIKQIMAGYELDLVPAMVINGKYRFDYRSAGKDPKRFIQLADFLIKREAEVK